MSECIGFEVDDIVRCDHDCECCKNERALISKDYKKLYLAYKTALDLIQRGYNGPFMGPEVQNLFAAVMDIEYGE